MNTASNLATTVAWLSFLIAFILGVISARTQFCTLGAVSDIVNMGDYSRMRMWVLAMAVAIIGAQVLYACGLIDLSESVLRALQFHLAVLHFRRLVFRCRHDALQRLRQPHAWCALAAAT